MKLKTLLILPFFLLSLCAIGQIETPQPSPKAQIQQVVGLTNVTVDYSRPAMRGRQIFGDLVPFDQIWRTGANQNSIISFDQPVTIGGQDLEAGSYAIFTKPQKKSWIVYFYSDTNNWGAPAKWDENKIAAQVEVNTAKISPAVQSFSIRLDHISNAKAYLQMAWENTLVEVPVTFTTDQMVMQDIQRIMNGPTSNDYYNAAVYYLTSDKDINTSVEWIEKAMSMLDQKPYWMLRQQSLIYAKAGMTSKAIQAAKASLAGARKAGNSDYIKMNEESIAEWQ